MIKKNDNGKKVSEIILNQISQEFDKNLGSMLSEYQEQESAKSINDFDKNDQKRLENISEEIYSMNNHNKPKYDKGLIKKRPILPADFKEMSSSNPNNISMPCIANQNNSAETKSKPSRSTLPPQQIFNNSETAKKALFKNLNKKDPALTKPNKNIEREFYAPLAQEILRAYKQRIDKTPPTEEHKFSRQLSGGVSTKPTENNLFFESEKVKERVGESHKLKNQEESNMDLLEKDQEKIFSVETSFTAAHNSQLNDVFVQNTKNSDKIYNCGLVHTTNILVSDKESKTRSQDFFLNENKNVGGNQLEHLTKIVKEYIQVGSPIKDDLGDIVEESYWELIGAKLPDGGRSLQAENIDPKIESENRE